MGGPVPPNGPPRLRVGASSIFALTALSPSPVILRN